MDDTEVLRRLAINDERFAEGCVAGGGVGSGALDPKTLALVRLTALVAVGGAVPSYGAEADAAVSAGATAAEIVEVLVGIVPVVGLPALSRRPQVWRWRLDTTSTMPWNTSPVGDLAYPPSRPTVVACPTASLREETPKLR
jgi:4-carboxymuconolactone decarboxylase